jgi:hypothetical protein
MSRRKKIILACCGALPVAVVAIVAYSLYYPSPQPADWNQPRPWEPLDLYDTSLWGMGNVLLAALLAWAVIRQVLASKHRRFVLPVFAQVCVVLFGSGISLLLAFIPCGVIYAAGMSHDTVNGVYSFNKTPYYQAFWVILVGGIIGSIMIACLREREATGTGQKSEGGQ